MPKYKNLVFKGGGVRGIAYVGALEFFFREGLMQSIERVAGTSVGAITAAVLALNYGDFEKVQAVNKSLEYRKIPSSGGRPTKRVGKLETVPQALKGRFRGLFSNAQCSLRLIQGMGWYSSQYVYKWIRDIIAEEFSVRKKAYTFRDFRDSGIHKSGRPFLDLYVTGTDLSNRTSRVFSYETTPDMEVALAVRISMSIPLFFETVPFRFPGTDSDQLYSDGGVLWNYPISLFDDPKYCSELEDGINLETLGFFLFSSPESTHYKQIHSVVDYVGALFESLILVQEQFTLYGPRNKKRSIFIDDMGVPPTQFDIEPDSDTYRGLYSSGFSAAEAYFSGRSGWETFIEKIRIRFGWRGTEY